MWHWLPNALFKDILWNPFLLTFSKRQKFLLQLCVLVLIGHLFLVWLFTLLYQSYHEHERFDVSLSKHTSVLVLSPLQKRIGQRQLQKKQEKDEHQVIKVIDMQTYEQQKKLPKKEEQIASKVVPKNIVSEKIIEKKENLHKKNVKSKIQAIDEKKTVRKNKVEQLTEQKNSENKVEEKTQDIDIDNATFVGYQELDSLMIQHKIQQSVQKHFKPPVGISKNVSCELSVQINKQGKSQLVKISKSSGVVVYDISARASICHVEFPKEVWNKTITIVLGQ